MAALRSSFVANDQIVIARYQEDVSWAQGLTAIVYNKGPRLDFASTERSLPNVGREAHAYLTHIVEQWPNFAERTLFTQAGLDHLPPEVTVSTLLAAKGDVVVPRLVRCREWGPDGRLVHYGIWKQKIDEGRMRPGCQSIVDWFANYVGLDLNSLGELMYSPGAIFAVARNCILNRPRAFYERLLETVSDHNDPEEAHYLERAWLYLFAASEIQVRYLSS